MHKCHSSVKIQTRMARIFMDFQETDLSTKGDTGICIHQFLFCPQYKSHWRKVASHKVTAFDYNEALQILEDKNTNIRKMWGYRLLHFDRGEGHKMFVNSIGLKNKSTSIECTW